MEMKKAVLAADGCGKGGDGARVVRGWQYDGVRDARRSREAVTSWQDGASGGAMRDEVVAR